MGIRIGRFRLHRFSNLKKLVIDSRIEFPVDFVDNPNLEILELRTNHPELDLRLDNLKILKLWNMDLNEIYIQNLPKLESLYLTDCDVDNEMLNVLSDREINWYTS